MLATAVCDGIASALIVFGASTGSTVEGHMAVTGTGFDIAWTAARWVCTVIAVLLLSSLGDDGRCLRLAWRAWT